MAAFSIEGEYITDLARTLFKEGKWKKSLNILECLDGLPLEDQFSILKGDKYLCGTNEVELLDDNRPEAKNHKKWISEKYNTFFIFDDKIYQPYATVDSWCSEDLYNSNTNYCSHSYNFTQKFDDYIHKNNLLANKAERGTHVHSRSLHYADNPGQDLALSIGDFALSNSSIKQYFHKIVLFQEVEHDVPFFLEKYITQDPLKSLEHVKCLEPRGANEYYGCEISTHKLEDAYINKKPALEEEEDYETQDKKFKEEVEVCRQKIIDFANNDKEYGWKIITDEDGNTLKVPGRAFLHYSLAHALYLEEDWDIKNSIKNNFPEYKPFSPSGFKRLSDNPFHTDAWLGAGLDLDKAYDESWQYQLFIHASGDYQKKYLDYDFHLLTKAGKLEFNGITCNPYSFKNIEAGKRILVLPHLGIEFEQIALQCDAIITEQGGPLAHLVTVTKEIKNTIPIIRVDNACIKFSTPIEINIDFNTGKINIQDEVKNKKKLKR